MPESLSILNKSDQKQLREKAIELVARGGRLEKAEIFPESWKCLADGAVFLHKSKKRIISGEWDGTIAPGHPLTVIKMIRHVGSHLRMARALHALVQAGMKVTLMVEPRLIPLLRRSLPQINVIPDTDPRPDGPWASYERVAQYVWRNAHEIKHNSPPLVANPVEVARLRRRYLAAQGVGKASPKPLIGISWWSSNTRKDLPPPQVLATALQPFAGQLICLQYSPGEAGFSAFSDLMPPNGVQFDPDVDPLRDLDASAAQIAAMDLIISVSNTTVHLAGAINQRCIVLMDDLPHLLWPATGTHTVFYNSLHIIRKEGRSWAETCQAAAIQAQSDLADPHYMRLSGQ